MKYIHRKLTCAALLGALLLTGCAAAASPESSQPETIAAEVQTEASAPAARSLSGTGKQEASGGEETAAAAEDYFSSRDLSGEYDASQATAITLSGSSISASSDAVSISGSTATITAGGTYILSGSLENGSVIVDAGEDKVQLVLSGVSIRSADFAAIYVKQADKVFITLAEGTDNVLTSDGFAQAGDTKADGAVFAKDDLTLNGSGSLTVNSSAGHGIVGKDDVTITGGTYTITAAKTAIRANDSLAIADGSFSLKAGTDGLHVEDNDDDSVGSIYICGGTFTINAGDDGIHATTTLTLDGGSFTISAAEGLEATLVTIDDGTLSITASDDGINAGRKSSRYSTPTITINGGDITIVMGSGDTDGVDANGDIVINGGTINVTGNSAFDYDGTGTINGGTVIVNNQQVTTLPNQTMGGRGGKTGGMGGFGTGAANGGKGTRQGFRQPG